MRSYLILNKKPRKEGELIKGLNIGVADSLIKPANPFISIHQTPKGYLTLSNGYYDEDFINDTLRQIGSVIFNTVTNKVEHFIRKDSLIERPKDNSRFLSMDPLAKKYPQLTPYQFSSNTPIQAVDLDGLEMYYAPNGSLIGQYGTSTEIRVVYKEDIDAAKMVVAQQGNNSPVSDGMNTALYDHGSASTFSNTDAAATDWGDKVNPQSIADNKEYSSFIFTTKINDKLVVTYTKPVKGDENSSGGVSSPSTIASIHSHGAYMEKYDNDNFSTTGGDIDNYLNANQTGYLVTPNGSLQKCIPDKSNNSSSKATISCNMPSDPNDPNKCSSSNIPGMQTNSSTSATSNLPDDFTNPSSDSNQ